MYPVTPEIINNLKIDFNGLSLYIHIPFCKKKCYYCDFYSIIPAIKNGCRIEKETTNLINNQLAYFLDKYPYIRTISIGGGTPSVLQRDTLSSLMKMLNTYVKKNLLNEFTIEANPESLDCEFISLCKEYNVTRISLGIQSFQNLLLQQLGRITDYKMNIKALELINKYWNQDFNIDLITGIPGQDGEMLISDIKTALSYNPCHISLYSLTIEEETELFTMIGNKTVVPLEKSVQDELWLKGLFFLKKNGYINYEISNFAKSGKICLHNLNYWKMNPYLGLGPGAVSTIPLSDNKIIRLYNPHNVEAFLRSNIDNLWNLYYEYISCKEFLLENLMMNLRLETGLNKNNFFIRFGKGFQDFFPDTYKRWKNKRIIMETDTSIALRKKHRYHLNEYLKQIYNEYENLDDSGINLHWPD